MSKKYKKRESAIVGIMAIALAVVFVIAYITISLSKSTWSPLEWTSGSWHGHLNVNSEYVGDNPDVVPGGEELHCIDYDTLGSGSVNSIIFDCPDTAKAGEEVSFTVLVESSYEISRVVITNSDTGEDIEEATFDGEKYYFSMPSNNVIVIFYLLHSN